MPVILLIFRNDLAARIRDNAWHSLQFSLNGAAVPRTQGPFIRPTDDSQRRAPLPIAPGLPSIAFAVSTCHALPCIGTGQVATGHFARAGPRWCRFTPKRRRSTPYGTSPGEIHTAPGKRRHDRSRPFRYFARADVHRPKHTSQRLSDRPFRVLPKSATRKITGMPDHGPLDRNA